MTQRFADSLVPARFLVLIAHLAIAVTTLWDREENVKACLPFEYEEEEYSTRDVELSISLYLVLACIALEMLGFLSGVSMFDPCIAVVSISCHAMCAIAMSISLWDAWDCRFYWWLFALFSLPPATYEIANAFAILIRR